MVIFAFSRTLCALYVLIIANSLIPTQSLATSNQIHFFNNAGASPSPPKVVQTITNHLEREVQYGGYNAAFNARVEHENVYKQVARLVNATDFTKEIALVESATVAWTRIFYSFMEYYVNKDNRSFDFDNDVPATTKQRIILLSEAEYAANVVAILKFVREQNKRRKIWSVFSIPSVINNNQSSGVVDMDAFDKMLLGQWKIDDSQDLAVVDPKSYDLHEHGRGRREKYFLDPSKIVLVCITHIPTNSGIINPVDEIGVRIAQYNDLKLYTKQESNCVPSIFYLLDACQSVGQVPIDVTSCKAHALSASGRKYLRGPRGTGFLFLQQDIKLSPSHVDHAAAPVKLYYNDEGSCSLGGSNGADANEIPIQYQFHEGAKRFEFWESNISTRLGLGAAIDHALDVVGIENIAKRIQSLSYELLERLRSINGVEIYHDNLYNKNFNDIIGKGNPSIPFRQCGIVTFSVKGYDASIIQEQMLSIMKDNKSSPEALSTQFELSIVPYTSTPIDSLKTGIKTNLVRASLSYFNTIDEIELFIDKLRWLILPQSR